VHCCVGLMAPSWHRTWENAVQRRPRAAAVITLLARHPVPALLAMATLLGSLVQPLAAQGDALLFVSAGRRLVGSHGLDVFNNPSLQVGPTYLLLLGLIDKLARSLGVPVWVAVGGLQSLMLTGLCLTVVRVAGLPTVAYGGVGLPLVLGGPLAEVLLNGHPEEVGVGFLLVLAAYAAGRQRVLLPAILVALASTSKLWGVIGFALLVAGTSEKKVDLRRSAQRISMTTLLCAAAYLPFFATGTVRTFDFAWRSDPYSVLGTLTGYQGAFPFPARLAQVLAAGGIALVLVVQRRSPPQVLVGAVAMRLLADPLRQPYYWSNLVVLVLLAAWSSRARSLRFRAAISGAVPAAALLPYLVTASVEAWCDLVFLAVLLAGALLGTRRHKVVESEGRVEVRAG